MGRTSLLSLAAGRERAGGGASGDGDSLPVRGGASATLPVLGGWLALALLTSAPALAQMGDAGVVLERAADPVAARRDHEAGNARLQAGDVGGAVELLRRAHALDPRAPHIAHDLGFALARMGARREAEVCYRRALGLDARRWLVYVNLLDLHADSPDRWQRRDEVLALVDRACWPLREDAYGWQSVSVAAAGFERSVGRLAEARQRLDQLPAVGLAPPLRKRANDTLRAIEEDERALELADWPEPALRPEDATTLQKAEAHLQSGHAALAFDLAGGLLARHPGASGARFLRARALQALTKYDQAIGELLLLLAAPPLPRRRLAAPRHHSRRARRDPAGQARG